MKNFRLFALLLPLFLAGSFAQPMVAEEPGKGFRFPGGDAAAGREAFASLNCIQCHTLPNVELPDPKTERRIELTLAFEVRFAKNYEGLVTAITNPRHVVTEQYRAILSSAELKGGIEPLMPDLTKDMSARQLMDLVAFLDEVYRKELPEYGGK